MWLYFGRVAASLIGVMACTGMATAAPQAAVGTSAVNRGAAPQSTAATVPLVARVQGLALGNALQLTHANVPVSAVLNDQYVISNAALSGAPLDIQVTAQPLGQQCALSELAPALIPADSTPILVRCRFVAGPHTTVPATLPDNPLRVLYGTNGVRGVAYPGIPYESRPGVVGGTFPYEFRLTGFTVNGIPGDSNSVALDFRHGTLRFTPATSGAIVLTLEIRDSAGTPHVLTQSFTIQSSISPFVFVAPGGQDSLDHGSRDLPYQTVAYALSHTTASQVIVLRKGSYATGGFEINDAHAKQLIAYPDEVATLDLNHVGWITVRVEQAPIARIEGLDIAHVQQYGFFSDPSKSGLVLRNLRFIDGREGSTPSENPAFIHGYGDSLPAPRHHLLVQDSDFGTFQMLSAGAYALTLFDAGDSLVENNQLRLGATSGGIHDKDNSQGNTYRENYIEFATANVTSSGIHVSAQANSENIHIHHNLLINAGVRLGLQCFQETCFMRNHDVHHNTLFGAGVQFGWGVFNPTSFGTRITHNIINNGAVAPYAWHSCLNPLPSQFDTQLSTGANLLETTSTLAMRDTECGGSAPMNMTWPTWRTAHGMDNAASGSVLTASTALAGAGPTTGLPTNDPRRPQLGHLYMTDATNGDLIFKNSFE